MPTKPKSKFKFTKNPKIIIGSILDASREYGGSFMPISIVNNSLLLFDIYETGGYTSDYDFYDCREEFHQENMNDNNKNKTILFTHNRKFNELSKFLTIIEDKLKIAKTKQSIVHNIQPKVALIEISDWWNINKVRQQFFTILIRAACNFNTKSKKLDRIETTLKSNAYFRVTYPAVELFLSGYNKLTNINEYFEGWVYSFEGKTKGEVLKFLKK